MTESQLLQEQSRRALGTAPPTPLAAVNTTISRTPALDASVSSPADTRMPRSLAALYLKPLRREAEYGVPSCDLQLRSYTLRNLEFYCDFALRAAYYLGLPAYGPVPLPRMIERWTVPRSSFIFKKSQENFERITLRRLIQIRDGHPDTVQVWLAFLQKHAYYGVGMKANVWEFSKLGVGKAMDESVKEVEGLLQDKWAHLGEQKRPEDETVEKIQEFLDKERMTISHGR
ncbi:30S ribosomal protein S10 [Coniochaeta sp. 2T2.1]|nr:30S ribosomal protein S10 [Coniochaeta sp. 2T2.1]